MPGFPVHHQLPELDQTHVHRVGDAVQSSYPLLSPSPLLIVVSNSLIDISKISIISESGSDACLISLKCSFSFCGSESVSECDF